MPCGDGDRVLQQAGASRTRCRGQARAGVGALGVGATDKVASELCGSGTGALPGGTGCFGGFIHCFLLFSQGRKGEELEGQAVTGSCRGQLAL